MYRMSTASLLAMGDKSVGDHNHELLERARVIINSTTEPRHQIKQYDLKQEWKEKERLGINFNRSVTMSLESRWEVVNKLTVEFLEELVNLNESFTDESNKQAKQLLSLILTRTQRMAIASRIEQTGGLLMHITFYRQVLKAKIAELNGSNEFLVQCAELMNFVNPNQCMDRYAALKATLNEIAEEREKRLVYFDHLQNINQELYEQRLKQSFVLCHKMADLHSRHKELRVQNEQLERFIEHRERYETECELEQANIKSAILTVYNLVMNYSGIEERHSDPIRQMHDLGNRLSIIIPSVKMVAEELAREATLPRRTSDSNSGHHAGTGTQATSRLGSQSIGSEDPGVALFLSHINPQRQIGQKRRQSKQGIKTDFGPRGNATTKPNDENNSLSSWDCNTSLNRLGTVDELEDVCNDGSEPTLSTTSKFMSMGPDCKREGLKKTESTGGVQKFNYTEHQTSLLQQQKLVMNLKSKIQKLRDASNISFTHVKQTPTPMFSPQAVEKAWAARADNAKDMIRRYLGVNGHPKQSCATNTVEDGSKDQNKTMISKVEYKGSNQSQQPGRVLSEPFIPAGQYRGNITVNQTNGAFSINADETQQSLHRLSLLRESSSTRMVGSRTARTALTKTSGSFKSYRSVPRSFNNPNLRGLARRSGRIMPTSVRSDINRLSCIVSHVQTVARKDRPWPEYGYWDDGVFVPVAKDETAKRGSLKTKHQSRAKVIDPIHEIGSTATSATYQPEIPKLNNLNPRLSLPVIKSSNSQVTHVEKRESLVNTTCVKRMSHPSLSQRIHSLEKRHSTGCFGGRPLHITPIKKYTPRPSIKGVLSKEETTVHSSPSTKEEQKPYAETACNKQFMTSTQYIKTKSSNSVLDKSFLTASRSPDVGSGHPVLGKTIKRLKEHRPERIRVIRNLCRVRDIRKNCLAILANVDLHSGSQNFQDSENN